jgi:hypothetical protein
VDAAHRAAELDDRLRLRPHPVSVPAGGALMPGCGWLAGCGAPTTGSP